MGLTERFGPFTFGESPDLDQNELPAEAIHSGQNVEFFDGALRKRPAITPLASSALTGAAFGLKEFIKSDGTLLLVALTPTKAYYYHSSVNAWTDITPVGGITGAATSLPDLLTYRDTLYATWNSAEKVQAWTGSGVFAAASGVPQANYLGSLADHLIVADFTSGGTRYRQTVKWANQGDPTNWTISSATDAGEHFCDAPLGAITGFQLIGDYGYLPREQGIERMIFQGPPVTFGFEKLVGVAGCWAPKSFAITITNQEPIAFYRAADNLYQFNGIVSRPLPESVRVLLANNENPTMARYSVGGIWPSRSQYWLSFAAGNSTVNDTTLVWDYSFGRAWLWPVGFSAMCLYEPRAYRTRGDLATLLTTLNPAYTHRGDLTHLASTRGGLAGAESGKVQVFALGQPSGVVATGMPGGTDDNGTAISSVFQTRLTQCELRGAPYKGPKDFGRVWLSAERPGMASISVSMGTSDDGMNVTWGDPVSHSLANTQKPYVDFRRSGRWAALRFENEAQENFGILLASMEWTPRPELA